MLAVSLVITGAEWVGLKSECVKIKEEIPYGHYSCASTWKPTQHF